MGPSHLEILIDEELSADRMLVLASGPRGAIEQTFAEARSTKYRSLK